VPAGSVDTTNPGFLVRPYQTEEANPNTIDWTEEQLAGLHGPNTADLAGADANGNYTEPNVINYDLATPPATDNFVDDVAFPGFSGPTADNITEEIVTWLNLKKGVYRMVVNSDHFFRVTVAPDPHDKASLVLGRSEVPGGGGFFDSLFFFLVETEGFYPFRLIWESGSGTASLEWFTQNVFGRKALVNSSTNSELAIKAYRSGPALPYVSRFVSTPFGFTIDYKDNGAVVLDKNTV